MGSGVAMSHAASRWSLHSSPDTLQNDTVFGVSKLRTPPLQGQASGHGRLLQSHSRFSHSRSLRCPLQQTKRWRGL